MCIHRTEPAQAPDMVGPMFLASMLEETFEECALDERLAFERAQLLLATLARHGYELRSKVD